MSPSSEQPDQTMPMFPLGMALLPGEVLPLKVFEPRYLSMIAACLRHEVPEFGVVMIERGTEVGGGDVRSTIGSVAQLVRVSQLGPQRLSVLAVGTRRIRVTRWELDAPYPQAAIADWPDVLSARSAEQRDKQCRVLGERVEVLNAMAAELGDQVAAGFQLETDPRLAVWQLCGYAPLGQYDRHRLLSVEGLDARLDLLGELLDEQDAMLRFRLLGNPDR